MAQLLKSCNVEWNSRKCKILIRPHSCLICMLNNISLFPGFPLRRNHSTQVSPVKFCWVLNTVKIQVSWEFLFLPHSPLSVFFLFFSILKVTHRTSSTSHSIYLSLPVSPSLPLLSAVIFAQHRCLLCIPRDFAICIILIFNLSRVLCWIFYRHSSYYWILKDFRTIGKWYFTYILASKSTLKNCISLYPYNNRHLHWLQDYSVVSLINFLTEREIREDE